MESNPSESEQHETQFTGARAQQILDEMHLCAIEINGAGMIPNSSQIPDILFDQVEGLVTPEEWKIISYIARRTFGFKRRQDKISRAQLSDGLTINGERKDWGTGLSEHAVRKALTFPVEIGLVIEKRTHYESFFEIQTDPEKVNWRALAERRAKKEAADKEKLDAARQANPKTSPSVAQKPSDEPVCATEPPPFCGTEGPPFCATDTPLTPSEDTQLLDTQEGAAQETAAPPTLTPGTGAPSELPKIDFKDPPPRDPPHSADEARERVTGAVQGFQASREQRPWLAWRAYDEFWQEQREAIRHIGFLVDKHTGLEPPITADRKLLRGWAAGLDRLLKECNEDFILLEAALCAGMAKWRENGDGLTLKDPFSVAYMVSDYRASQKRQKRGNDAEPEYKRARREDFRIPGLAVRGGAGEDSGDNAPP